MATTQPPDGVWIFVSHSLKDWKKVRRIRNMLEEKGHKPLLFFLKCLDDDSEIDGLIRREIETRNWFLLCDSENAQASNWVQSEIEIIKSLPGKVYKSIDLGGDWETQTEGIDELSKRATVFISYSRHDATIAQRIADFLATYEYRVWLDVRAIASGPSWAQQITAAIDASIKEGFILLLLSPDAVASGYVGDEVKYALQRSASSLHGANVIPIIIRDVIATIAGMSPSMKSAISTIQWLDFTKGDFDANIATLVQALKTREME